MDTATLAPRRLGSLLVDKGYLTPGDLQSALEKQKQEGRKKLLGEILVEQEYCTEDQVVECLAAEYGVPYAKLDARLLDPKVVDVLPREYVEKNLVLPLFLVRGVLTIAVSEPSNLFLIDEVRGLDRRPGSDRRRQPQGHPADDRHVAELQGLRDRRHHRALGHGGRDVDRGGHRADSATCRRSPASRPSSAW